MDYSEYTTRGSLAVRAFVNTLPFKTVVLVLQKNSNTWRNNLTWKATNLIWKASWQSLQWNISNSPQHLTQRADETLCVSLSKLSLAVNNVAAHRCSAMRCISPVFYGLFDQAATNSKYKQWKIAMRQNHSTYTVANTTKRFLKTRQCRYSVQAARE